MGRVLSIDFGKARVGLAISDETQTIAQGLPTINYKSEKELIARIRKIIEEQGVSEIVIGNPISLSGKQTKRSSEVLLFLAKLKKTIPLPIRLLDERLTSQLSMRILGTVYSKVSRQKEAIDKLAATIILKDYLTTKKNQPETG
jgi:putative Holliday junction resolvase|uniref:Putative pre-16S rRNA nuclease n=1 Tax=candidate division WOR-3 bacterium TaxID=2052148 RepID=A0A7C6EDA9_UNCW3